MGTQIEWKCSQHPMSQETSLDDWNINSDQTISEGNNYMNSLFKHNYCPDLYHRLSWALHTGTSQTWLDILLKWSDIQHNWLEIVCCPAVILSSVYDNHIVKFCCYMYFQQEVYYFEHDVSAFCI